MGNLSYKDAIAIFESVLENCKKVLQQTSWPSKEFDKVLLQSSAVEVAIAAMHSKDSIAPVQNQKGEWVCPICGCNVDFEVMPGITGDFCGHCGKGIDWLPVKMNRKMSSHREEPDEVLSMNSIGERIKALRKENNLTQSELAALLSKSLRTIQKYESGEIIPSVAVIDELAAALNTTSKNLLGYE